MKSMKDIEQDRKNYHHDKTLNSVHQACLTVPHIPGTTTEISFVNHFLLKRGDMSVACRITAVDGEGQKISAKYFPIKEPRVYQFDLSDLFADAASYIVEFFSADNLFIPFPAVMVNHSGDGYINMVHSYNRILSDVFEDDVINNHVVSEASVDVLLSDTIDTFAYFTTGCVACAGQVEIELAANDKVHKTMVDVDMPRFSHKFISLKETFPEVTEKTTGVLKMRQPKQLLFYGRMLAGMTDEESKAFSANHSYYDSSNIEEYWDTKAPSFRVYPTFKGLKTSIRSYPILSPGKMQLTIDCLDENGTAIMKIDGGILTSPSHEYLDVCVEDHLDSNQCERMNSIVVNMHPVDGNTPTRVAHQLVYRDGEERSELAASIQMALKNADIFIPDYKVGFGWGQVPVAGDFDSFLGVVCNDPEGEDTVINIALYGPEGLIQREPVSYRNANNIVIDVADIAQRIGLGQRQGKFDYIWYVCETDRADVAGYSVVRHKKTGNCSGEHSF